MSVEARRPARRTGLDAAMTFVSVALPASVCASRVARVSDASHDEAVVRALGHGWTGAFRALDAVVAAMFQPLPLGTHAFRAGLACAGLCGVAGGLLYALAKRLVATFRETAMFGPIAAAIATSCVSLGAAWLVESRTAGSSIAGVVLALLPLIIASSEERPWRWPAFTGTLMLALTYEPVVGLVATAGSVAYLVAARSSPAARPSLARREIIACTATGVLGCLPLAVSLVSSPFAAERIGAGLWAAPLGEGGHGQVRGIDALVSGELGWMLVAMSVAGGVLALANARSRPLALASTAIVLSGALGVALRAPAGPWRYSPAALLLLGGMAVLAAFTLHRAALAVAEAKVPLAPASAAMLLLLALTLPVLTLDEAIARADNRAGDGARAWDDAAFEALPAGALLLVPDRALYARALASRATGELRPDLALVPSFDPGSPAIERALEGVPDLVPLVRDFALFGEARERTLSSIAATRPLAFAVFPRCDRALSRHFVPAGLFDVFYPEPRGASERRQAVLSASEVAESLEPVVRAPGDAGLAALTATILRARAQALGALGEKENAARVENDSVDLALPGAGGARRARRLVTSRLAKAVTSR